MTQVINLFGGPGIGKSTLSSGLFYEMKNMGLNVELVQEYVKKWAWQGKSPGPFDQIYLLGKQANSEYSLYGKVDFIITDSPILLYPFYEQYYNDFDLDKCIIQEVAFKFIDKATNNGIKHYNFILERFKPYNPEGRFQKDEREALEIDQLIKDFIVDNQINYTVVTEPDSKRVESILRKLGLK